MGFWILGFSLIWDSFLGFYNRVGFTCGASTRKLPLNTPMDGRDWRRESPDTHCRERERQRKWIGPIGVDYGGQPGVPGQFGADNLARTIRRWTIRRGQFGAT